MSARECESCGRQFVVGETAYAADWTVINGDGVRTEVRYTCEDCEAAA